MFMKSNIIAIFCLLLLFSISASGQRPKKPAVKKPVYTVKTREEPIVSGDRFFFVITLDREGNATTSVQNENGPVLTPAQSAMFFKRLSRIGDNWLAPGIIIKPDWDLKYGMLLKAAAAAQEPSNLNLLIATDDDNFYLAYPKLLPDPDLIVAKPNPLTLLLEADNEGLLYLNREPHGSLTDTGAIENLLKRIFKDRADNGVFREGTNLVETAIYIRLPENSSVADLMKIVKVLRNAGSDWIGLDSTTIEAIREVRAAPRTRQ